MELLRSIMSYFMDLNVRSVVIKINATISEYNHFCAHRDSMLIRAIYFNIRSGLFCIFFFLAILLPLSEFLCETILHKFTNL